jgi:hypothetical protein
MRKGFAAIGATLLASAGVAMAASGPTVKVSLTPNKPNAHSKLSVSASGNSGQKGLPTSLKVTGQKGFKSSAKSVTKLCDTSKVTKTASKPCPAKSKTGSGKAVAYVPALHTTKTVPFTLYLGKPTHKGDIAAIILSAHVPLFGTQNVKGRLFKTKSGGVEFLFSRLIKVKIHATLKSMSFSSYAVNGKYSLITNPPSCGHGRWSGTFKLGFSTGSVSRKTSIACTK